MMDFVINSSIVELTTNPLFLLRLIRVENNTIYSPKHCLSPQFIHFQLTVRRFSKLVKIKGNNGRRMARGIEQQEIPAGAATIMVNVVN